jgi:hypothetical protein
MHRSRDQWWDFKHCHEIWGFSQKAGNILTTSKYLLHASHAALPIYINQNYPLAVDVTKLLNIPNYLSIY